MTLRSQAKKLMCETRMLLVRISFVCVFCALMELNNRMQRAVDAIALLQHPDSPSSITRGIIIRKTFDEVYLNCCF
jgi:hypothetical protein